MDFAHVYGEWLHHIIRSILIIKYTCIKTIYKIDQHVVAPSCQYIAYCYFINMPLHHSGKWPYYNLNCYVIYMLQILHMLTLLTTLL